MVWGNGAWGLRHMMTRSPWLKGIPISQPDWRDGYVTGRGAKHSAIAHRVLPLVEKPHGTRRRPGKKKGGYDSPRNRKACSLGTTTAAVLFSSSHHARLPGTMCSLPLPLPLPLAQVVEKEYSIEAILKELAEIQNQGPKNYCVLGTRHCSFLHQQVGWRSAEHLDYNSICVILMVYFQV